MSFLPWLIRKKFTSTLHVNDLVKKFNYKKATHLIAISIETKQYAKDLFGYKEENISIVHHGVSETYGVQLTNNEKTLVKEKNNIPIDKIIIGFVGSIEKRKGHDLLLKATSNLPKSIQDKIHLVFVGSSKYNTTKPWLLSLIQETGTSKIVSLFDYQDPKQFYAIFMRIRFSS